jgi:hypothetical protein
MNFYPFNHEGVEVIKDNKAILRCHNSHFCGYVAFPFAQIPKKWWGNYNADALQYLSIHGGLTYAAIENDSEKVKELWKEARDKIAAFKENDFTAKMKYRQEVKAETNLKIAEIPESYAVFGFDCNHAHDEEDSRLQNPNYVMKLTEQMEAQISEYAKRYDEWLATNRERRVEIMQEIINHAEEKTELGFGAMLGLLTGASEFDAKEWREQ